MPVVLVCLAAVATVVLGLTASVGVALILVGLLAGFLFVASLILRGASARAVHPNTGAAKQPATTISILRLAFRRG